MTKITALTKKDYSGYVYNLEVKDDNTYVGEGIIFHNCDDVLADPTDILNLKVIDKVNTRMMEIAFSMPKEGGSTHIIGTAQSHQDFFFRLKDNPNFSWGIYPAITDWKQKKVLWPDYFSWDRLMELKTQIGEKAFSKEYMVTPVWSTDTFFTRETLMPSINNDLKNYTKLETKNTVGMGWDIGKHSHPAYVTAFEFISIGGGQDIAIQRHITWMDGWDYGRQLEYVQSLADNLRADWINYDNTRGELEGFMEKGMMDKHRFIPVTFTIKMKHQLAAGYEKRVCNKDKEGNPNPTIQHINHQRSINQILTLTNDLQSIATSEGHSDSYWGNSLALYKQRQGECKLLGRSNEW